MIAPVKKKTNEEHYVYFLLIARLHDSMMLQHTCFVNLFFFVKGTCLVVRCMSEKTHVKNTIIHTIKIKSRAF